MKAVLVIMFAALCGCGGGGGGSSQPSQPIPMNTPPPPNEALGGIWSGTSTNDQGGPDQQFEVVSTDDGRFSAISLDNGGQFVGNMSVTEDEVTATGFGVAPAGSTWLDGSSVVSITLTGQISEHEAITATWNAPSTGESGTLNLQYDSIHTRESSSSKFNGQWVTAEQISIEPTTGYIRHSGFIDGDFTLADGDLIGLDTFDCQYSGTIRPVDTQYNVYDVEVMVASCGDFDGDYAGLGTLTDTINDDSSLNSDAGFVFAINNGSVYLTDVLFRIE